VPRPEHSTDKATSSALVRAANIHDVPAIHALLDSYAQMGNVLSRPMSEIYRHLRDFFVIETGGEVVACAALEIFTENLGEVRSLVIQEKHKQQGLGKLLVQQILKEAQLIGLSRLMALTYVPEFFIKLGFKEVSKNTLPEKVWGICVKCYKYNRCDETAVLIEL